MDWNMDNGVDIQPTLLSIMNGTDYNEAPP